MHAGLDRVGNESVPTAPLGAEPPQLAPLDQFEAPAPAGVAPVHVKSVSAVAGEAVRSATAAVGAASDHALRRNRASRLPSFKREARSISRAVQPLVVIR